MFPASSVLDNWEYVHDICIIFWNCMHLPVINTYDSYSCFLHYFQVATHLKNIYVNLYLLGMQLARNTKGTTQHIHYPTVEKIKLLKQK